MTRVLAALIVAAFVLSACSRDGRPESAEGTPPTSGPTSTEATITPSASPTESPSRAELPWREVATRAFRFEDILRAQIHGDWVVFACARLGAYATDLVAVWNVRTGEFRELAETAFPETGVIGWLHFDGERVTFVDVEKVGTFGSMERLEWRLRQVDLYGQEHPVVASSPTDGSVIPPLPTVWRDGLVWVTWQDEDRPRRGRKVWRWEPGEHPRVVWERVWVSDEVAWTKAGLLFLQAAEKPWPSRVPRVDLALWPGPGEAVRRLTSSGLVIDVEAGPDGTVIWTESRPAMRRFAGRADPYRTYTARLGRGEFWPTLIQEGFANGNPRVGSGWVAWWDDVGRVRISTTDGAFRSRLPFGQTYVAARLDAQGDRLVFGTRLAGDRQGVRLHVVEVQVPEEAG